jgi:hypothetical protein
VTSEASVKDHEAKKEVRSPQTSVSTLSSASPVLALRTATTAGAAPSHIKTAVAGSETLPDAETAVTTTE